MPSEGRAGSAVRAALVVGALCILAAVLLVLAQRAPRSAGSEDVAPQLFVRELDPGGQACQRDATIPAGTARVSMVLGTYGRPGPRVDVVATGASGRVVARGGRDPGWTQGPLLIPFGPVRETVGPVEVCVINRGDARLAVGGEPYAPKERQLQLDYVRAGEESWFQTAPRVIDRFAYGKPDLLGGGWTLWVALGLVLAGWAAAARALLRAARCA